MEEIETDSPEYIRTTTGGLRAMSYIVVSSHSSDGHDLRIPEANLIQRMVAIQPGPINELSKQVANQLNQAITSYYSCSPVPPNQNHPRGPRYILLLLPLLKRGMCIYMYMYVHTYIHIYVRDRNGFSSKSDRRFSTH